MQDDEVVAESESMWDRFRAERGRDLLKRWGNTGNEASSEEGAIICMGNVQEALKAAKRCRAPVQPTLYEK